MQERASAFTNSEPLETPSDAQRALLEVDLAARTQFDAEFEELTKYRLLARQTQMAGQLALAEQLSGYADQLCDDWVANHAKRVVNQVWHAVQTLSRVEQGQTRIFIGLDDEDQDQRALHDIRQMLLGQEDDEYIKSHGSRGQSDIIYHDIMRARRTNYTLAMPGGMQYVEIHEQSLRLIQRS